MKERPERAWIGRVTSDFNGEDGKTEALEDVEAENYQNHLKKEMELGKFLGVLTSEYIRAVKKAEPRTDANQTVSCRPGKNQRNSSKFWVTALKHNPTTGKRISAQDEEVLKFLRDVQCGPVENNKGFALHFHFAPNPYFKNKVLSKFFIVEPLAAAGRYQVLQADGTDIDWLPDWTMEQKHATVSPDSSRGFFEFFKTPTSPNGNDSTEELLPAMLEYARQENKSLKADQASLHTVLQSVENYLESLLRAVKICYDIGLADSKIFPSIPTKGGDVNEINMIGCGLADALNEHQRDVQLLDAACQQHQIRTLIRSVEMDAYRRSLFKPNQADDVVVKARAFTAGLNKLVQRLEELKADTLLDSELLYHADEVI
ncbi:Nucleosome assembly protein NAP-1 [Klebsormidium nitens]|uniref:Nucleosome assembly protein NAP-1 n=1 Tax=Klebsormidium nitens TaxID=105231 RepID=A0A1Y1IPM9_KLENI|nr:Nucleosome assembly protein NAP-1 [Klebsormidium nitens]|eukprot:GAQ90088.1 Nucleosome assembly protein NAP-1 [Klebsormidium nitens]